MEYLTCTLDFDFLEEGVEFKVETSEGVVLSGEVDGDLDLKIMLDIYIPGYDLKDETKVLMDQVRLFEHLREAASLKETDQESENDAGEDPYLVLYMKPPELLGLLDPDES